MTAPGRTVVDITFPLSGSPEVVFPLLCPVREYEWIPDWTCRMVHSESGVAELGCVFARAEGETWITTRYEPPYRIDYAIVRPHLTAGTLALTLTPHDHGTRLDLRATVTALNSRGAARMTHYPPDAQRELWDLRRRQLEHFLATGTALAAS